MEVQISRTGKGIIEGIYAAAHYKVYHHHHDAAGKQKS